MKLSGSTLMSACVAAAYIFAFAPAAGGDTLKLFDKLSAFFDTGGSNSLEEDPSVFAFLREEGKTIFVTSSTDTNVHSHYNTKKAGRLKNYTYTGKMRIDDENGGIGVTFYSNYPSADEYYRLRRYSGNPTFHLAPHGTEITDDEADVDTGVNPEPGVWYKFKVKLKTFPFATRIQARVWRDGEREPREWQIDFVDAGAARFQRGKPGVWSMGSGGKRWADLKVKTKARRKAAR